MDDRYGFDVLANDPHRRPAPTPVHVTSDLVVEETTTGWVGAVVGCHKAGGMHIVTLEDRFGKTRSFPLGHGFMIDGQAIELLPPLPRPDRRIARTNSGSRAVALPRARVARPSRIWVEGRHDAELVEYVWGDDLRVAGIVVEILDGIDNLPAVLAQFQPHAQARAGVLVDHLITNSKESRIAAEIAATYGEDAVLITGHPFVDIWQAIKPQRVGLTAWPEVPRGTDIKVGSLQALGLPHATPADIGRGWQAILARVRNYRDLDRRLLAPVEQLLDFVTEPHAER